MKCFLRTLNPIHVGSDKSEIFVNIDPTSFFKIVSYIAYH
jgi:hypothetical protein